jgi:hypothetical protein
MGCCFSRHRQRRYDVRGRKRCGRRSPAEQLLVGCFGRGSAGRLSRIGGGFRGDGRRTCPLISPALRRSRGRGTVVGGRGGRRTCRRSFTGGRHRPSRSCDLTGRVARPSPLSDLIGRVDRSRRSSEFISGPSRPRGARWLTGNGRRPRAPSRLTGNRGRRWTPWCLACRPARPNAPRRLTGRSEGPYAPHAPRHLTGGLVWARECRRPIGTWGRCGSPDAVGDAS